MHSIVNLGTLAIHCLDFTPHLLPCSFGNVNDTLPYRLFRVSSLQTKNGTVIHSGRDKYVCCICSRFEKVSCRQTDGQPSLRLEAGGRKLSFASRCCFLLHCRKLHEFSGVEHAYKAMCSLDSRSVLPACCVSQWVVLRDRQVTKLSLPETGASDAVAWSSHSGDARFRTQNVRQNVLAVGTRSQ